MAAAAAAALNVARASFSSGNVDRVVDVGQRQLLLSALCALNAGADAHWRAAVGEIPKFAYIAGAVLTEASSESGGCGWLTASEVGFFLAFFLWRSVHAV